VRLACAALLTVLAAQPAFAGALLPGFVRLADIAPTIAQDMRYAGPDNFTGAPVPGYRAPQCWLRAEAASALAEAQADAAARGFGLIVYDCYRPKRAVAAFVAWSQNPDQRTKAAFYPSLEKRTLFAFGYIAAQSSHSTGLAVDLGVKGWDFGGPFDFFDPSSWTASHTRAEADANRQKLVALMRKHGFVNYPREWWHFNFVKAASTGGFDIEIQ
jgi:zinc D-Ala-D-Ala dipeptidase